MDSVYETKTCYYLIFELFSGGNLKEYIKQHGVFSEDNAIYIIRNILEGLRYLHEKNIMHRDIKPENILFRTANIFEPNQIVIADFGLATYNNVDEYIYGRCGTPGFVAPEIYAFVKPTDHYGLKCDLFSVGVTFFYMLTGTLPYAGFGSLIEDNMALRIEISKIANFSIQGFFLEFIVFFRIIFCFLAKNFFWKLFCVQDKRYDVNQALKNEILRDKSLNTFEETEGECGDRDISLLSSNLQEFNAFF